MEAGLIHLTTERIIKKETILFGCRFYTKGTHQANNISTELFVVSPGPWSPPRGNINALRLIGPSGRTLLK